MAEAGIDMRLVEKQIMLQILISDGKSISRPWTSCDRAYTRAYAQKQPKQEFKRESFELFQDLLQNIKFDVVRMLSRMQIENPEEIEAQERLRVPSRTENELSAQPINGAARLLLSPRKPPRRKPLCVKSVKWAAMNPVLAVREKIQAVPRPTLIVMRCL